MAQENVNTVQPGGPGNGAKVESKLSVLTPPGLVSILVPCCGQLEYTRLCVPALLRHTRAPFELIFVDVGALDGTAEYLAGVQAAAHARVEVVRTATDLGVARAVKDALKRARGEYVALVNNDTLVPEGWLQQLVGLAGLSPALGMVGPMSNYAAPPQLVEEVPYRVGPKPGPRGGEFLVETEDVYAFARQWREEHKGKWQEVGRLGGFCLLVKRAVLDKVGVIEGEDGLGMFDTDELSVRARQAGFTLALCRDLFVHHFGTRTFAHGSAAVADEPGMP